jgi:hypothetical protein
MHRTASEALVATLRERFAKDPQRHLGIPWEEVAARLAGNTAALGSLAAMESSGGEPDVIGREEGSGRIVFCDCAAESPAGRRSTCYDGAARLARKEHAPETSALEMAAAMGVELVDEEQYRHLQTLGSFDTKTSSWIATPAAVRALGGALFGDRRYGRVFVYHNGAASYYAARGFRARLVV